MMQSGERKAEARRGITRPVPQPRATATIPRSPRIKPKHQASRNRNTERIGTPVESVVRSLIRSHYGAGHSGVLKNARDAEALVPDVSPKQRRFMEAVKHNRKFARKVGVPQSVGREFVEADRRAGLFQTKGTPMAKKREHDREHEKPHHRGQHHLSGHGHHGNERHEDKVMSAETGVSPRKGMAMGEGPGSGNFGVQSFEEGALKCAGTHPDAMAKTGAKPHLEDHERGIGHPIHHTDGHHPAQAAPDHGPTHPGGHMQDHHGRFHDMVGHR